jgi:hypothetical protein
VSILKKLFGRGAAEPKTRVRVCVECGMPVEKHSDWCSIFRTNQELERKRAEAANIRT